jgi:hypothetical protein
MEVDSKMSVPRQSALILLLVSVFPMSVLSQATAKDQDVRSLIYELRSYRWEGPYATALPLQWDLRLTEPMRQILEIGSPAQEALLENITDPLIKYQIIILLGGVGDERSIGPIINAMIGKKDQVHSKLRTDQSCCKYRSDKYYRGGCRLASRRRYRAD